MLTVKMYPMTVMTLITFLSGLGSYNLSRTAGSMAPSAAATDAAALFSRLMRVAQLDGYFTSLEVPPTPPTPPPPPEEDEEEAMPPPLPPPLPLKPFSISLQSSKAY